MGSNFGLLKLRADCIYLICSGSSQKQGLVAGQFNISDQNATHVGIGIMQENVLNIYNVNSDQGEKSALSIEDFYSFTSDRDFRYCSIYEYKSSKKEVKKLKDIIQNYLKLKIEFDMDFDIANEKLYCSEFCALVLNQWDSHLFSFGLTEKKLDAFYAVALKREILQYFPVDFFQNNRKFKKIYESFREH